MAVSIIVPAYNEEGKIEQTLAKIKEVVGENWEIIVVDDGSTDKTDEKARKYAKVISYKPNRGKGYAMRAGAKNAKGDIIVFIDAEGFYPKDIPKLVEKLREGYDIVVGRREKKYIPWPRRINICLVQFVFLLTFGKYVVDPLSGFIAVKKEVFERMNLKENGFEIESEMVKRCCELGMKRGWVRVKVKYNGAVFSFNKLDPKKSLRLALFEIKEVFAKTWVRRICKLIGL